MLYTVGTKKRRRTRARVKRSKAPRRRNPRTAKDFFAEADRTQQTWNRVLRAISKMRTEDLSLKQASKEAGVSSRTVVSWGGRAIKKGTNGRYTVSKGDSLLRVLHVPTAEGTREVALRNSRQASILGEYWDALQKYLRTGDSAGIEKFQGKRIKDANGVEIPLMTDLAELNRLGSAGVLSFESLYARAA